MLTPEWVGAIGQWVGAAFTFWAVWVALHAKDPNIKITICEKEAFFPGLEDGHSKELHISVVNTKRFAVKLTKAGFFVSDAEIDGIVFHRSDIGEPKQLFCFECNQGVLMQKLINKGYNGKVLTHFFVIDDLNAVYKHTFCFDLKERKLISSPKIKFKI